MDLTWIASFVIPALVRLRQENLELRPSWTILRPCYKKIVGSYPSSSGNVRGGFRNGTVSQAHKAINHGICCYLPSLPQTL